MILITTSRKPCRRTRSFCKDIQNALPDARYHTRGKTPLDELLKHEKVIYITDKKGNPGKMEIYEKGSPSLSVNLKGVRLKKEIKELHSASESKLASKISSALGINKNSVKQSENRIIFNKGPELIIFLMGEIND